MVLKIRLLRKAAEPTLTVVAAESRDSEPKRVWRWRCYLEPQLVDASSGAQDWMYCEGLVDYDAVRAASLTMYEEAMASMKAEEVTHSSLKVEKVASVG